MGSSSVELMSQKVSGKEGIYVYKNCKFNDDMLAFTETHLLSSGTSPLSSGSLKVSVSGVWSSMQKKYSVIDLIVLYTFIGFICYT